MDDSIFLPAANSSPRHLRILLVEDHEETLASLFLHLTHGGHFVTTARSVAEALTIAHGGTPDILLCDITLPDADGCELLTRLAENRPPLCIAMSGYGMNADLRRSQRAGFHHHLTKPFLPDDLDALLPRP